MLRDRLAVSKRWACRVVGQHRSTQRHELQEMRDHAATNDRGSKSNTATSMPREFAGLSWPQCDGVLTSLAAAQPPTGLPRTAKLLHDPTYPSILATSLPVNPGTRDLSAVALQGALDLIAVARGGVVEGYPHDTRRKHPIDLYHGTRSPFERAGFTYDRPTGTTNIVMIKTVATAVDAAARLSH